MHFGPRSERLPEEQLQLGLEAIEQAIAKKEAEAEKRDAELRKEMPPGGVPAEAHCRHTCRGSR